jgi:hypothetical protein
MSMFVFCPCRTHDMDIHLDMDMPSPASEQEHIFFQFFFGHEDMHRVARSVVLHWRVGWVHHAFWNTSRRAIQMANN